MVFSDHDAREFAHIVAAIETAGGTIVKAELGQQESQGFPSVFSQLLGADPPTRTTFCFLVAPDQVDGDASDAETRQAVVSAIEDHPIGEGGDISETSPIPCGFCGGIMHVVEVNGEDRYSCEDCEAVLHPAEAVATDEEVDA